MIDSTHTVKIEKLIFGGDGLAKIDGKACFVPYASVGDELEIKIVENKKDFCRGQIVRIITPSTHRRRPPCIYAEKCGGCSWQHLEMDEQLRQKHTLVKDLLHSVLKKPFQFLEIEKSPQDLEYRNRIILKFNGSELGYFAKKSHFFIPIEKCLLADEKINANLEKIKQTLVNQKIKVDQKIDKPISVQIYLGQTVQWRLLNQDDDTLGFSQVNSLQNDKMVQTVVDWSSESSAEKNIKIQNIYDLYAGNGNFSFPLYDKIKPNVISVELDKSLSEQFLAIRGKRNKIKLINSSVENFIRKHDFYPDSLVILDPPRGGCSAMIMRALASSDIKKIIYISCNPVSMARDLALFFQTDKSLSYRLGRVKCFDMFPQTDHVETVAEIIRNW